ncbi:DUF6880 family protein [Desulfofustis glycolicus]|nr:DUF6880 family protein [Desulfofustis glycolicus]
MARLGDCSNPVGRKPRLASQSRSLPEPQPISRIVACGGNSLARGSRKGHDKRDDVINDEARQILKTDRLQESDAEFLIAVGKIDEAEKFLLKRADQLDGNHYGSLLSLAETMEAENRHFVTSLIYRSLLISILERGYTKAFPHGISCLEKLDKLAASVADWKGFNHHEAFKEQIIQAHGRKRSFWSKYVG